MFDMHENRIKVMQETIFQEEHTIMYKTISASVKKDGSTTTTYIKIKLLYNCMNNCQIHKL